MCILCFFLVPLYQVGCSGVETCMEILLRFPAGNTTVKGTECEGYPRKGKLREPAGEGKDSVGEGWWREIF